jgi:hypothetical protein
MTDRKITELPAATLPLAGTEPAVVVQGGETRQAPASALGLPAQVDVFAASGTWTKPAGAKAVEVFVIAGGSGGGSGRKGAEGSARFGGGGGSGGAIRRILLSADALPDTVPVTVGAGGVGGASATANDSNGNAGTAGGDSSFGPYVRAGNGFSAGAGGTAASGGGGGGTIDGMSVGQGGGSSITATAGSGAGSPTNTPNPTGGGGGGGGGRDAANVSRAGGGTTTGGFYNDPSRVRPANTGVTDPAVLTPSAIPLGDIRGNGGGAGGFSGPDPIVRDGGTGGEPGGAGGGGAAGVNGVYDSGRGGDGGRGRVTVFTYF